MNLNNKKYREVLKRTEAYFLLFYKLYEFE